MITGTFAGNVSGNNSEDALAEILLPALSAHVKLLKQRIVSHGQE